MENGYFTRQEIYSQPEVWKSGLEVIKSKQKEILNFFSQGNFQDVFFTGCGSTYYLSLASASSFTEFNQRIARGLPASELWLYPGNVYPAHEKSLLIAVSRSGSTTETLRACEAFKADKHGSLLTISCYPEAPLAEMGDLNLVFPDSREESIAQTRSFSTMYLATIVLCALWSGKPGIFEEMYHLSDSTSTLFAESGALIGQFARNLNLERFYFLGSGSRYGLACEISLKMKEMSLSHSEPFHFMEFRHGPMSMVNEHTLILGFVSEANYIHEMRVLEEMQARGAHVLSLGEHSTNITFKSSVSESLRNVLYLPLGQILAFERSLSKGLNPDKPNNLDAVVVL